jgi:isopenicillin-N N-acyltransferase like protein
MSSASRYRQIEVGGAPYEMGCQIGEAAREEIGGFNAIALEQVQKTLAVSRPKALEAAAACIPLAEAYATDMVEELRGMAFSSGVSLEELMLLQIRNQLQPDGDAGCTSFAAPALGSGPIVGQNWDNDPALDPFTVVLVRRPQDKPALMNVTQAGLIAYIGLNEAGIGICMNTLPAPSRGLGVPHYFTVRGIYEATSLQGAVEAVSRARRAIPANLMLSTPQGPVDLEITLEQVHQLRDSGDGVILHTNHCLHPELVPINADFPELIQSGPRLERMDSLLRGGARDLENMKEALRDHQNHPHSICRHANADPANGFWVSVLSVLIEAEAGCMHISRGNPCENPYETYRLD